MAGDWTDLTLGDLGRIVTGKTPPTAVKEYFGGLIPFVTPSDMDGRKTISATARYLTDAGAASVKGAKIAEGAVMVSCIGSDMGKAVMAGGDCVTNQQINSIIVDDRFSSEFVYYNLSTRKDEIRHQAAGGSAQPILNKGSFSRLRITLPSLPEQKRIAHILGTLDDKIELNRRMNATLEAMSRAIFKSWFVDFDPVRQKAAGKQPVGMDAQTAALFPDSFEDSEVGEVPKGWRVQRASDLYEVAIGKTPPRKEPQWFSKSSTDVPWMSIKDLGEAGAFILGVSEYLTAEAVERFRVRRIPDGTVVLSFKLTVGRVAITDGEMLSNEAIAHFLPLQSDSPAAEYLYCYLKQFDYGRLGSTSSIATAVNSESVRSIQIVAPCERSVALFCEQVGAQFRQVRLLQRQSRTLAALRDTLLPKLLSGEIRVPEAEEAVEEAIG
jgi:type I restriction enzyme S subunit